MRQTVLAFLAAFTVAMVLTVAVQDADAVPIAGADTVEAVRGDCVVLNVNNGGDAGVPIAVSGTPTSSSTLVHNVRYEWHASAKVFCVSSNTLPDAGAGGVFATVTNGVPIPAEVPMDRAVGIKGEPAAKLMCISEAATARLHICPITTNR